jgi:8-oxo-dGTP pyrophosphatase MutT (NUDIX family)
MQTSSNLIDINNINNYDTLYVSSNLRFSNDIYDTSFTSNINIDNTYLRYISHSSNIIDENDLDSINDIVPVNLNILAKPHTCRNCGNIGHLYKDCPHPITSFGIICYRINPDLTTVEYVMIQRKDSLCFMEFIRGKYDFKNINYIRQLLSGMTQQERKVMLSTQFEKLWNHVWYQPNIPRHTSEFNQAKTKFITLKKGFYQDTKYINMQYLIQSSISTSLEPEWGFPKGRRRIREEDVHCALREFSEETGLPISDVKLDKSFSSYEETFYGTNFILYRHVYYVGYIDKYGPKSILVDTNNINQAREVSSIEWFTYDEVLNHINEHNKERKQIFIEIHKKIVENLNKNKKPQ